MPASGVGVGPSPPPLGSASFSGTRTAGPQGGGGGALGPGWWSRGPCCTRCSSRAGLRSRRAQTRGLPGGKAPFQARIAARGGGAAGRLGLRAPVLQEGREARPARRWEGSMVAFVPPPAGDPGPGGGGGEGRTRGPRRRPRYSPRSPRSGARSSAGGAAVTSRPGLGRLRVAGRGAEGPEAGGGRARPRSRRGGGPGRERADPLRSGACTSRAFLL